MRRHLAAVMFTDVVGYTSTVHRDEDAGRQIRSLHRAAVEGAMGPHGGTLLQYFGDGSLSLFPSAVEAVAAALEIQEAFGASPQGSLRIGIDLGDIAYDEQGAYGDAVNVASRLESLSAPGGVLISGKVHQEVKNHSEFEAVPLGAVPLRNVEMPVPIFALSGHGLRTPEDLAERAMDGSGGGVQAEIRPLDVVVDALWEQLRPPVSPRSTSRFGEDSLLGRLPLVGREGQMAELRRLAEVVENGEGRTLLLTGDRGVGKTRLVAQLTDDLAGDGWLVTQGQAYSTELGVPFAPVADAFGPLLSEIRPSELQVLAQGGANDLASLWPPLARWGPPGRDPQTDASDAADSRSRLLWTLSYLLATLSSSRPLLIVLEDLQWADGSSLDLLHFVARQISDKRVLLIVLFCESEIEPGGRLREVAGSLERQGLAQRLRLGPLSRAATEELVTRFFAIPLRVVEPFARRLFEWTRGNAFFLEGALRGLVETGHLRRRQGRWLGWEVQELELPASVRDAISSRLGRLSPEARKLADLAALMGGQVAHDVLVAVQEGPEDRLVPALEELVRRDVLDEAELGSQVVYQFSHPLIPESLVSQLPLAVARSLHARIAKSLETHFGDRAHEHVDELAYHFARAHGDTDSGKALLYLTAAGRKALKRHADSEAARYLEAALVRLRGDPAAVTIASQEEPASDPSAERRYLLESLAQARANLGDQDGAITLWQEALELAEDGERTEGVPKLFRCIGQAHLSSGRLDSALQAFQEGTKAARASRDRVGEARLKLVEGVFLQQAGRSAEAMASVDEAREIALELEDTALLAKVERGFLLIHLWNGKLDVVLERGSAVRALAAELADPQLMFWSEWTLAAAAGLRGNTEEMLRRVQELERLADRTRSPSLRLWATELSLEYAYASGAWDVGVGVGEQAASLGRALNERTIHPRILVCLALIYLGRGDMERADELLDEAWELSGAGGVGSGVEFLNVHTAVPAHIGKAARFMAVEEWDRAIEIAKAGLEVADRTGYVLWGIHRLLPILCEAYLSSGHIEGGEAVGQRLRACGEDLDHDLARAWATASEALVAWLKGDPETGARLLRPAAEVLEEIPMVFDAARLRRQLAGRLAEIGDREGAVAEIHRAQEVFRDLGATCELERSLRQEEEILAEG